MSFDTRISLAALALGLLATPAFAADAPATDGAAAPAVPAEIIVTANKRSEKLHDVPASVSAASGVTLAKLAVINAQDLVQIAPSLSFQASQEARLFSFSVRGIGTFSTSVAVEPSVSTIVDGVVYARPGAIFDSLSDLERVEVLSGPQGTLQGKNASAGVVNIITARPNKTRFEGKAEATVAQNNEFGTNLILTGPLTPNLAFRAAGYYRRNDGLVTNVATGKSVNNVEAYGFRGKLAWDAAPGVSFLLIGDISHRKADCCAEPIRQESGAGTVGNVTATYTHTPVGPDNTQVNYDTPNEGYQNNRGVSLQADIAIGSHTLTSITAYRYFEDFARHDRDGTNAPFTGVTAQELYPTLSASAAEAAFRASSLVNSVDFVERNGVAGELVSREKNQTFSQELRIASPTGGLVDYIGGLFFYDNRVERDLAIGGVLATTPGVSLNPLTIPASAYKFSDLITVPHSKNYSAFASVNVHPVSGLTLTLGGRYIKEDLTWFYNKALGPNGDLFGTTYAGAFTQKFSDQTVVGKFGAKYDFTRDLLVYGSVATGYKGEAVNADITLKGTPNPANPSAGTGEFGQQPVAPEKSRSFEFGFKGNFLDRKVVLNIAYYDTAFRGYQTASAGTDGSAPPVLRSAGHLYTHGVEGDLTVRPLPGLMLNGNFLFSKNKFGDLFVTPTLNIAGGIPIDAPSNKIGGIAQYDFKVADWGVGLTGNYTWTDKTLFSNLADANNPNSPWLRPAYGIANASIGITAPGGRYKLMVFVKNVFDKHYASSFDRISATVGGAGAIVQSIPRDFNRYVGGTLTVNF